MTPPIKLPVPIWIVTPRESTPDQESCDEPQRHALAFAVLDKLMLFLATRQSGDWRMRHVMNEVDLVLVIADLHQENLGLICLEPNTDGSGGTAFALREVMGQIDQSRVRRDVP